MHDGPFAGVPVLHVQLFGQLSIARRDGTAVSAAVDIGGRPGGLLAFLSLGQGHYYTRHELIEVLWADQPDTTRSGTFNTTLWRLRKALQRPPLAQDGLIVCDRRGAVGVPSDAQLQLDVAEFARLVEPGLARPLEQLGAEDVANLKRGVALYRDDMLTGFADEWALRERELQRRRCLNALARLMHVAVLQQDLDGAIDWARQILDRDPLREDIHRELMRLLLASGQRALALRQYECCRDVLRRELAIQPMRETLAVYQQIAEGAIGHGADGAVGHGADGATGHGADGTTGHGADGTTGHDTPSAADRDVEPAPATASQRACASDLVANARRHLAQADAQLQRCLPLLADVGSAGGPAAR